MNMKKNRILVAEDDHHILNGLIDTLESEGYQVVAARDGRAALDILSTERFDLILLDIMMPEISGYEVCSAIRAKDRSVPIIMLTAKGEEIDKVVGLRMGADDYITKPFGIHELIARIEAALRRSKMNGEPGLRKIDSTASFRFARAKVNGLDYTVRLGEKVQNLSEKELKLLRLFHAHPNEALSREKLLDEVWGVKYFGTTRTLDQHIARLRKKVEPDPANPENLITVHGIGYKYIK